MVPQRIAGSTEWPLCQSPHQNTWRESLSELPPSASRRFQDLQVVRS